MSQTLLSTSRAWVWIPGDPVEAESGFGRRRVMEGFRRRSPRRRKKSWSHHGVPGSARCPLASLCLGRTSRVLELTGRTCAGHCLTLSFTQRISPTRFSPAVLRAVYVLPCGSPLTPRPVGQPPSAFLCLKSLSVGWTSLSTSFLRVYLPPVSVYQWVSPAAFTL